MAWSADSALSDPQEDADGNSYGTGVTLEQCKYICDAAGQADPPCTGFEYKPESSDCTMFSGLAEGGGTVGGGEDGVDSYLGPVEQVFQNKNDEDGDACTWYVTTFLYFVIFVVIIVYFVPNFTTHP